MTKLINKLLRRSIAQKRFSIHNTIYLNYRLGSCLHMSLPSRCSSSYAHSIGFYNSVFVTNMSKRNKNSLDCHNGGKHISNDLQKILIHRLSSSSSDTSKLQPYDTFQMLQKILSSKSIATRVESMSSRYNEIMDNIMQPSSQNNSSIDETKELSSLSQISKLYNDFKYITDEMNEMHDFMIQTQQDQSDDDEIDEEEQELLLNECQDEIKSLENKLNELGTKILEAALPRNEDDYASDAIIELRAGTGGDEACLFCGELMEAYEKAAKHKGWSFEVLLVQKTDLKGVKEAAISINSNGRSHSGTDSGEERARGPYGYFKFESGVHRVQRVPVNDVRIHTSAASVAVLPAQNGNNKNNENLLPLADLRIETMRASGAGGQHVNTTDSAVRITHIPTGITASMQDERSQHKNKAKALKLIAARVNDKVSADEARQRGDAKNSLMGGGDRSERIRTYNFPQDRITDHRCKHSEHGIEKLLSCGNSGSNHGEDTGLVGVFAPFMGKMERDEILETIEEEERRSISSKDNHKQ
mmetsp:Transcript_28340/g.35040  ORF Transcript_28340/g.35040 Transcript_28340/m.35040 type:complete len:529 (-) Transcript_28340:29-1615(-)